MSFIALVMTCCVAAWPGSGLGVLAGWRCGHLQEFGDFEVHDGPKIGLAIGFWLQEEVGVRVLSWCDSISILCIFGETLVMLGRRESVSASAFEK